jgi:hypothetical protein
MTLFRVTIYQDIPEVPTIKPWTNVYYVDTATKDLAAAAGEAIWGIQKGVAKDYVRGFRAVAQSPSSLGSSPSVIDFNTPGEVPGDLALRLPLFNTVRVRLTDGINRPSQKYLRLPLEEGDIENGTLTGALTDLIASDYSAQLMAFAPLRTDDGVHPTSITGMPDVQMRQTNWKRRTREGFHRGWVPD